MSITIEKIEHCYIKRYLNLIAKLSNTESFVICDQEDNVLYASKNFLITFANKYKAGTKFINYKVPNNMSIYEKPFYSKTTRQLLWVKYEFKRLINYDLKNTTTSLNQSIISTQLKDPDKDKKLDRYQLQEEQNSLLFKSIVNSKQQ